MNTLADGPVAVLRDEGVRGAQSVRRALGLLRGVAKRSDSGVKLAQLVRESGLDRGTAYRLLTCLVEEGFVDRDEAQLYRLGPQAVMLGSLMPALAPLVTRFGPGMKRIARIAGDTVFLMVRHGDMVQCDHREVGGSLVKILTTEVGQRRPLGTGTGGVALLGLMDDDELRRIWQRHAVDYTARGIPLERLLAMAHAVRTRGCAITFDSIEAGVAGIGLAFRLGEHAMGALSIGTLTARFGPERQHELGELLATEIRALGLGAG
ncbi:MAG: IclR family transcriptional regulator [Piscinibacter sp.]